MTNVDTQQTISEPIFIHDDFYVVHKPANFDFHDEGQQGEGFFNYCQSLFGESLFPVHRLDKITSGLLIVARTLKAAQWFQNAFEQQLISKFYVAIANTKPNRKQGSIIGDMTKSRRSQWKLNKSKTNAAITRFKSSPLNTNGTGERAFLLKPETGKTHQLRVALKSLSSPILGDELYGGEPADRVYLHAARLTFDYNNETIDVSQLPTDGGLFLANSAHIATLIASATDINWPTTK